MEKKNKIIFINPPLTAEDRYGLKVMVGGNTPPLGLANLAAMTRLNGYETSILDAAVLKLNCADIVKEVVNKNFKYVGITGATIAFEQMSKIAKKIKKTNKNIIVLVGGPHLTAIPKETMERCKFFDIGLIGEGDYSITELLNALEKNKDISLIPGLIIRKNNKLFITEKRPPIRDLDKLPMPAWDLLPDLSIYYRPPLHTVKRIPAALLVASRGCPGQCIFCDRSVFGNVLRAYSAEYTLKLIEDLYYNYGIREIQLRDDNYLAFQDRLIKLCKMLIKKKMDLVWTCAGRVDMMNPKILNLMKEAGCWQIWFGVESGSQEVLDALKKKTKIEQIKKAINMTQKAGINPCGFFIIGNPSETKETLEKTINFATELPLSEAHFSFMTPFPGSEIYNRVNEFGKFDNDWKKLHGWFPVFIPFGLKAKDLEYYSKKAFRKFYFRPKIILAYLKKIRSISHIKYYFLGFLGLLEILLRNVKKVSYSSNIK